MQKVREVYFKKTKTNADQLVFLVPLTKVVSIPRKAAERFCFSLNEQKKRQIDL
jgi:hypothetical protein